MVLLKSSSCNFDWQPNNFKFSNLRGDEGSFYDSFDINGLLVMFIGIGQMFAGYVYPNQPDEINKAVEGFEKE